MSATLIASVPITPVSTYAYVPGAVAAFSAATSSASALPAPPSFSISIRPTMSPSIAFSAETIFASWRSNSNWFSAPRQRSPQPKSLK